MRQLSALLRLVSLYFLALLPVGGAGWLLGGLEGLAIAAGILAGALIVAASGAERFLSRAHRAVPSSPGLARTLERIREEEGLAAVPRLAVFHDPSPNAFVCRSLGGSGTILLSQGLTASLNEGELRAVLRECIARCADPGLKTRSACAVLANRILALAPESWVRALMKGDALPASGTGPLAFGAFLIAFPIARFFVRLGGHAPAPFESGPEWDAALRKIQRGSLDWNLRGTPGAVRLYLSQPWPRGAVFSASP